MLPHPFHPGGAGGGAARAEEEDSMAFTVTVTERPKDDTAPGKACDACDISICGGCICLLVSSDVEPGDSAAADLEDWAAVGLSPVED
jgi:hypothetical protein